MNQDDLAKTGAGGKGFYGWVVVVGLALIYFSICGTFAYSFAVFLPSISEELHWNRTTLSGAFTLYSVLFSLLGPLSGWSIVRFGARKNLIWGNLLLVLALVGLALVEEVWHVYLFYGLLGGFGTGIGGLLARTTVVANWFTKRRSLVMGIVAAAGGAGGLVFPPVIAWMVSGMGWRPSVLVLAGIQLVLAVGVGGWLVRGRPADIGQVPDGVAARLDEATGLPLASPLRVHQTVVDWEVGPAMRQPATWFIIGAVLLNLFGISIVQVHQVAYVEGIGFSLVTGATVLALIPGMSIVGRLALGGLALRFEIRYLLAFCFALRAAALVILISTNSLPLIYLYAALFGISHGVLLVARPVMIAAYYGPANYPKIYGWISICGAAGFLGSLAAGAVYDRFDSYLWIMIVAIGLSALGIVFALLARPPKLPATYSPAGR
ncbi:MFS transporter [Chloroflexota bacterium]